MTESNYTLFLSSLVYFHDRFYIGNKTQKEREINGRKAIKKLTNIHEDYYDYVFKGLEDRTGLTTESIIITELYCGEHEITFKSINGKLDEKVIKALWVPAFIEFIEKMKGEGE
jgi:hypothetical protein